MQGNGIFIQRAASATMFPSKKEEYFMKLKITAKKMQISQSFTDYAEERLSAKLDRFFGDEATAKVTLSPIKNQITLEVTVIYDNVIFRAEQSADDKNAALDACIDKIIRMIRKNKTRIAKKLRDTAFTADESENIEEESEYQVIKHKKFELRPMSVEEAILQMNLVGHSFFMFKNAETGAVNVVYKRDDGNYSVLEPEMG